MRAGLSKVLAQSSPPCPLTLSSEVKAWTENPIVSPTDLTQTKNPTLHKTFSQLLHKSYRVLYLPIEIHKRRFNHISKTYLIHFKLETLHRRPNTSE